MRLDEGHPANYVIRSVSGKVQVDGVVRSGNGTGPTTNYAGSVGELSGRFADVRAHSVSGDITVLRRAASPVTDAAPPASVDAPMSPPAPASASASAESSAPAAGVDEAAAGEAADGFDREGL